MSQVEWGSSMETANGTRQNVNGGKLENNILVQEIDLSYAILPWSMNLDSGKLFTKTFGDFAGGRVRPHEWDLYAAHAVPGPVVLENVWALFIVTS